MAELKNFCHMPFRELFIEHNSGDTTPGYRSCCIQGQSHKGTILNKSTDWFSTDSNLVNIRKQFLKDKRPSNCANCWIQEDKGIESSRQKENRKYVNKFRNTKPTDAPVLEVLDIRLTNKCNLQCKMCYAGDSDQIAKNIVQATKAGVIENIEYWKNFNVEYFKDAGNIDPAKGLYEFIMANDSIREIKFAGGESFLMPEVEELMVKLIKAGRTNLNIFFLTNCTTVKTNVLNILKKFDHVEICCSIDGTGKWIEYQRFPVKWESVKRNYNKLLKHGMEPTISPCWSHLNILGLSDFLEWMSEFNDLPQRPWLGYNEVQKPSYLEWELIPMKYRINLIEELDDMNLSGIHIDNDYHTILKRLQTEVRDITKGERKELQENVKLWDFNNPVKYRDMFPWAKELLGE